MLRRMLENVEAQRARNEADAPAPRSARARKDDRPTKEAR
jgi:hypothetical protein